MGHDLKGAVESAINRPLRCLLAELGDVADWIERTKPQGLLYDSARPAMREAKLALETFSALFGEAAKPVAWGRCNSLRDSGGRDICMDEPEIHHGSDAPDDEGGWYPLYRAALASQDQGGSDRG